MLLKIDVTRADIKGGIPHPAHCPVALAANRALRAAGLEQYHAEWEPYRAFARPEGFTVWGRWRGDRLACQVPVDVMPEEAYDFASDFDDWYRQEDEEKESADPEFACPGPFSFEVELPLEPPRTEG